MTFKIYVGMALTDAPEHFRSGFQHILKSRLRMLPYVEVLDFYWTSHSRNGGEDIDVYGLDRQHVENADLCLFILDYPSLGLGGEIERREMTGKPFLAFRHIDRMVSRYTRGLCQRFGVHVGVYTEVADILDVVRTWCEMGQVFRQAS